LGKKEKTSVDLINLNRLSVLADFRQRMVIAEKVNEVITLINKIKLV
tara:strand:- start:11 stop:151 length:141 start_codon:yes stop_codon:yes gene_type:complete